VEKTVIRDDLLIHFYFFYFILIKKAYKGGPESWNWKKK